MGFSVLNECPSKDTPTLKRQIGTVQSTSLHERITVRHELGPARRTETQPYANIRNVYASQLEHRRLIKYTLARRPECILRDAESAGVDRKLIHMPELGTDDPRGIAGQNTYREAGYHFRTDNLELLRGEQR